MNVKEIADKFKNGDITRIAEITGASKSIVNKIFAGTRNYDTTLGRKILAVARELISQREALTEEFNNK